MAHSQELLTGMIPEAAGTWDPGSPWVMQSAVALEGLLGLQRQIARESQVAQIHGSQ